MKRASFFIDGFNLYHAIDDLRRPELKWLNLRALADQLISPQSETVVSVFYLTAYALWRKDKYNRHRAYVRALEAVGVQTVIGRFKEKPKRCRSCGERWIEHEEKETDVNVALAVLNEAYKDTYDRAYVISCDSDLKPAVAMVRNQFPDKDVFVVSPPERGHSNDLIAVASGKRKIRVGQVERCLFGEFVTDGGGNVVAHRPAQYEPSTLDPSSPA